MWLLFLALTGTAVAAEPLFQTATLGSGIEQELQEPTPGSILQEATTEWQEPTTEWREPTTEWQEPTTEWQEPTTEWREPTTEWREPTTEWQEPTTEWQEPTTEWREPTTEWREPTTEWQEPTTEWREPTTEWREPTTEWREPTTEWQEPTTEWQEPTTEWREPTTKWREPTTEWQEPTTGSYLEKMAPGLQEVTPGSILQKRSDVNVDQYLRRYGYMNDVNERSQDYDQHRRDALKSFQSFVGLQVTGEENDETRKQMLRPRCGMKDIEVERPSNARWNMSEITYWFRNYSPDLDKSSIHQAFEDALGQWSGPSKLNFKKIESGTPIMEIRFVTRKHTGCYFAMDGPGGVLAHAFFPARHNWAGDIHFDDDETYKYKTGRGYEIASVTLHEAGHSLGLGHDSTRGSIMMPWYNGQTTLGPNDIARIKSLYA